MAALIRSYHRFKESERKKRREIRVDLGLAAPPHEPFLEAEEKVFAWDRMMAVQGGTESTCNNAAESAVTDVPDEEREKTLEFAEELTEKGSLALKEKSFHEAINCFRLALEIRVAHYGELSDDCLDAYYEYGCCLLEKAQDDAVKQERQGRSSGQEDLEEDGEDCQDADADEGDSDLDMARKMLDIARAITEKALESCEASSPTFQLKSIDMFATERDDVVAYLSGLAEDIEKKLEDVKQLAENPKTELMGMASGKAKASDKVATGEMTPDS